VELQLERRLGDVKENLCKLVTVTGQTKSGKTVLPRRVLPPEETIWVDGGTVSVEDDFWHVVIEHLDIFQSSSRETGRETSGNVGGSASAGANFVLFKGEGGNYGTPKGCVEHFRDRVAKAECLNIRA
jgi:hypothetical protein